MGCITMVIVDNAIPFQIMGCIIGMVIVDNAITFKAFKAHVIARKYARETLTTMIYFIWQNFCGIIQLS